MAVLASACAKPPPKSPADGLPSYSPEDASLLDDNFSGHLFETAFVPGVAGDDPHFAERALRAESIWVVKVATVSREGSLEHNRRYELSFRTLESLAGAPSTAPFSLTISGKDPTFHWLDRVGGAWVGKEVLLMVRNFRSGDELVMHFHGEPNTAELRARIGQIRAAQRAQK
ncbi:MAG TPA: hypothetical protein VHW01_16380 [Polyangiaceae bacterium]|nr:hypothetical protein [Polyangiaceae bacterium]